MSDEKDSKTGLSSADDGPEGSPNAGASDAPASDREGGEGREGREADVSASNAPEGTESAAESTGEAEPKGNDASPEAVLRRLQALDEDSPEERRASEEERRLAERRAATRGTKKGTKKKGTGGLEVSASKKLAKLGTRAQPRRSVALAADADPLVSNTLRLGEWAQKNVKLLAAVGVAVVVGLAGVAFFVQRGHQHEVEASTLLTQAVAADRAYVGEIPKDADPELLKALGPTFKTYPERTEAALAAYRDVEARFPKTGAAMLAKLSEGSLLLDKRDADGAVNAFTEASSSPLAAADKEVKGRALEGLGFAYELKAVATPAEATKFYDEALKTYKELENVVDVLGFKELAMYHQARVTEAKGDKQKAKELLVAVMARVDKPENFLKSSAFMYLKEVAGARLRAIDPSAVPATNETSERIRRLMQQRVQQQPAGEDEHP